MSTSRPFAYNTGSTIDGTEQVGDIAIGTDLTQPYASEYGGVQWWAGPDEELGYVICKPISAGNQPNPVGIPCYIGFERSDDLTDQSFINLANTVFPGNNFTTAAGAKSWMDTNGYWTSYAGATGATGGYLVTITQVGSDVVMTGTGTFDLTDLTYFDTISFGGFNGGLGSTTGTFVVAGGTSGDRYYGASFAKVNSFGIGGTAGGNASSRTGSLAGIVTDGIGGTAYLVVPAGYTSGTVTGSSTFTGQTITSLGLTAGTYINTWGSGENADALTMIIGGTGATGSTGGTGGTGGVGGTGDFNVTITQVGPDVVWSGSGSFNLNSLTLVGSQTITSGFQANNAIWIAGASTTPPGPTGQKYGGASLTYPTSFLSGTQTGGPSATTGSMFGVLTEGVSGRTITVPDGYVSGTTISGSTTYANQTIAGMGLSGGTYVWAWGSAPNTSTLVMTIG
jgi:hypothetical protein